MNIPDSFYSRCFGCRHADTAVVKCALPTREHARDKGQEPTVTDVLDRFMVMMSNPAQLCPWKVFTSQ